MTNSREHIVEGLKILLALALLLYSSATLHGAEAERFLRKVKLPTGQTAVVAEGDFEARSIGSFSVRLYEAAPRGDETTFFIAGLVLARNGVVEKVVLTDMDNEGMPEIVVIVRSVGTGGYLSAYAITFDEKKLVLRAAVDGLLPEEDPIQALRKSVKDVK